MKYIVLSLVYAYVVFMAYSAFGLMGIAYVVIVPIPFIAFSYFIRKRAKSGNVNVTPTLNIWASPVPYLSIVFVGFILFNLIG